MAGAPMREKLMAHYSARAVNVPLTAEQARIHPLVYASHDMGEVTFTYFIVVPLSKPPQEVGPHEFVCPFERIVRWPKYNLRGGDESTFGISQTLIDLTENEQLIKQMRVKEAVIESQLGPQNPKMYALSRETATTYLMRKKLTGGEYPEAVTSIGAQSKFSYFFLKCPTGTENYDNRKRLAVVILDYLLRQWCEAGKIPREWYKYYDDKLLTGDDKKDDYADPALQLIVYLLEKMKIAPQWTALEALYRYLMENPRYGPTIGGGITQKWPLAFTAAGEVAYDVLERGSLRNLERAGKRLHDLIERAQAGLNRNNPRRKPISEDIREELNAAAAENVRCTMLRKTVQTFVACQWMLGNRLKNKAVPDRIDCNGEVYVVNGKARKRRMPKVNPAMEREYEAISQRDRERRIAAPTFAGASTAPDPNDYGVDLPPDAEDIDALMAANTS